MISAVSGTSAASYIAPTTSGTWTTASTADMLSHLTAQDWALGSAMAGKELDHDPGTAKPAALLLMAQDRTSGRLPADQPVSESYLRAMASVSTNPGYTESINRAIALLKSQAGSASADQVTGNALDLLG
ncbi:hypothetical protein SAMN05443575_1600 [Jatrophihabitans endophyticus]|uniref:Uncharacterized protein n=1 Tax=Jatrophihabitans endophyticus TaxID=1206085 RepID=A0A1M5HQA9_9ACTN|nr:hypothetical protein [Jatrophihabitans endophyticus]SHG18139.1 hypothetical protein SAMN05443575_1600 [Jatrophihabitans endophyticus]